jgi:hypothetical protein
MIIIPGRSALQQPAKSCSKNPADVQHRFGLLALIDKTNR